VRHLALPLIAVAVVADGSCGGKGCGEGILHSIPVPGGISATLSGTDPKFFDVDLSSFKFDEVNFDSTNIANQPGRVDGMLTTADCTQMFAGPYTGGASGALCKIILGPIGPGGVTDRVSLAPGRYRVWAQPYSTNTGDVRYGFDVVLWGPNCSATPGAPGSF
jgi:hypothetical protein